jgi:hypothetical protein
MGLRWTVLLHCAGFLEWLVAFAMRLCSGRRSLAAKSSGYLGESFPEDCSPSTPLDPNRQSLPRITAPRLIARAQLRRGTRHPKNDASLPMRFASHPLFEILLQIDHEISQFLPFSLGGTPKLQIPFGGPSLQNREFQRQSRQSPRCSFALAESHLFLDGPPGGARC